jgi:epoxyqueuosine reductase
MITNSVKLKDFTNQLKAEAKRLGFFSCGISAARRLDEEEIHLQNWLKNRQNAEMKFMENHFEIRLNPQLLVPDAKSVISLIYPYFPHEVQNENQVPVISKYAYGEYYQEVVKEHLNELADWMKSEVGEFSFRTFSDSAPILEKRWAEIAGLGWIGKNRILTVKNDGSFFFIGSIVCDLQLEYDSPAKNLCGNCKICIESCPTSALSETAGLDARKCISYWTIENRNEIPKHFHGKFRNRVFGCDICQDVCPHNAKPILHNENRFLPKSDWLKFSEDDWYQLSEKDFNLIFKKSALKRRKYAAFKRNLYFLKRESI